jgi:hypothetical protein
MQDFLLCLLFHSHQSGQAIDPCSKYQTIQKGIIMTYELDVAFTNDQLQTLWITGTNVIVAKPSGGTSPNVAWQVFKPLQANALTWDELYSTEMGSWVRSGFCKQMP